MGAILFFAATGPPGSLRRKPGVLPVLLVLACLCTQLALLYLEAESPLQALLFRTLSPDFGGYFSVASRITDVAGVLRDYPAQMLRFEELHPRTHPPGLPLIFFGVARLLSHWPCLGEKLGESLRHTLGVPVCLMPASNAVLAAAWVQITTPLWGALTVVPLAAMARRLFGEETARRGLVFYVFVPSVVLYAARFNQLYAFLAVSCLCLLQRGLDTGRHRWFFASGAVVSLATFLDPANLALVPLSLGYGLLFRACSPSPGEQCGLKGRLARQSVTAGTTWALGVALVWVAYYAAFGVSFFEIARAGMKSHWHLQHAYLTWLGRNLVDFLVFLGISLVLLILKGTRSAARVRLPSSSLVCLGTFWLVLLLLDGSGTVRSDAPRLWLFFAPIGVLAALPALATLRRCSLAWLLAVQIAELLLLGSFGRTAPSGLPLYYGIAPGASCSGPR